MSYQLIPSLALFMLFLTGCASQQVQQCPPGTQNFPDCPPLEAVNDADINRLYVSRTWLPPRKQAIDPIKLSAEAKVPINQAYAKVIGPTYDEALRSLAAKLWLIENAQHTIDVMYYIFARDAVGYAVLGALCNAVQRGVDVRMMVDSVGSLHPSHDELRALETCASEAGFMRNIKGQVTTRKARVQVVIFNALSNLQFNRRSHDKILVVDGHAPDKAAVMTGGRNISLDYYGIKEDGSRDPTAFRDVELLLRANPSSANEAITVGSVAEIYYTLLFFHKGNKRIEPLEDDDENGVSYYTNIYLKERKKAQQHLAFLKSLPELEKHYQAMPRYMSEGFHIAEVRLAHQLHNLISTDVTTNVIENIEQNPNSIIYLMKKISEKHAEAEEIKGTLRIVSPYLFSGKYKNKQGEVVYDGAKQMREVLHKNPGMKLEVITNSVLTSDNFFTQAIIDMDMAPRFLLTPELQRTWLADREKGEFNPQLVESEEWKKLINHPQVFIYQTGGLDSVLLGGGTNYGKLHAKFIIGEHISFIGTSNFDYRSNLYNNEMGFLIRSPELRKDLDEIFQWLKSTSYRWGTPQWLKMRRKLMEADTKKSAPARQQRPTYKTIRGLGLEYLM
jgi:phosphatidylserine/phosphatidylglycerophosphate/cardiolipin synthase-like enzyme